MEFYGFHRSHVRQTYNTRNTSTGLPLTGELSKTPSRIHCGDHQVLKFSTPVMPKAQTLQWHLTPASPVLHAPGKSVHQAPRGQGLEAALHESCRARRVRCQNKGTFTIACIPSVGLMFPKTFSASGLIHVPYVRLDFPYSRIDIPQRRAISCLPEGPRNKSLAFWNLEQEWAKQGTPKIQEVRPCWY